MTGRLNCCSSIRWQWGKFKEDLRRDIKTLNTVPCGEASGKSLITNQTTVFPPPSIPPSQLILCQLWGQLKGIPSITSPQKNTKIRNTSCRDCVPGRVLKACSNQLATVFTDICNQSLQWTTAPSCLKAATITQVPMKPVVPNLNDYRPIALQ